MKNPKELPHKDPVSSSLEIKSIQNSKSMYGLFHHEDNGGACHTICYEENYMIHQKEDGQLIIQTQNQF